LHQAEKVWPRCRTRQPGALRRGDRHAVVVRLHGHRCVVAPGRGAGHAGSGKHARL